MFNVKIKSNFNFDSDKMLSDAVINGIVEKVPQARPFKHLIKTKKVGSNIEADLSRLPVDIVQKINQVFG